MIINIPATKSPVPMAANAKVFYNVPTGEFKIEKATRNRIQIFKEESIPAWITDLGAKITTKYNPGSNLTERQVRGYFLVPKLPTGLRSSDRVKVELESSSGDEQVILFFSERATPLKDIVIQSLGIPFEGYVQIQGGA
jgi:hypothetical protein